MSDKRKPCATSAPKTSFAVPAPKTTKVKRPITVSVSATPSTSRTRMPTTVTKEKVPQAPTSRTKLTKNPNKVSESDTTLPNQESFPEFDPAHRRIAYGKFLRAMLEDCLVDEKIEREETQMDVQMGQLAERFQKTIQQLDITNKRLKNISFTAELNRIKALKSNHCDDFYSETDKSKAEEILQKLNNRELASLNKLHTKNVNFGFKEETGHQQLLDAVNDAIEGLEQIKKHSNLNLEKFKEYHESQINIEQLESERMEMESLKNDYDDKYLSFNEQLIREASERIAKSIMEDEDYDFDDDSED